ncbi:MAG: hypothetical protein A2W25_06165 [candidate division Zixibacteria bacterium RBG_16_53_22]|nr:MAG: hypothetical protein A2W25_06165 [candidate division Zixibacteria bacterium RBG_16_53_22]
MRNASGKYLLRSLNLKKQHTTKVIQNVARMPNKTLLSTMEKQTSAFVSIRRQTLDRPTKAKGVYQICAMKSCKIQPSSIIPD